LKRRDAAKKSSPLVSLEAAQRLHLAALLAVAEQLCACALEEDRLSLQEIQMNSSKIDSRMIAVTLGGSWQ
jgi:hypothetical protein